MAVDLRIEVFAYDNFLNLWSNLKLTDSLLPRPKVYGVTGESDCTVEIHQIVLSRYLLFRGYLIPRLAKNFLIYARNGVEIYHYLCKNISDLLPYSGLNIFDKLTMSCAIVGHIGWLCHYRKNNIFKYVLPLCWAMYFEKEENEEFLAAGGWKELKSYAAKYYAKILYPPDIYPLSLHYKNDVITVHELFKNSEYVYSLYTVIDTFKQRLRGRNDKFVCSKCLPLYDLLYVLSSEINVEIDSFKLVEGFYQIFLRMLPLKLMDEIYYDTVHKKLGDTNIPPEQEQGELVALNDTPELNDKLKTAFTEKFIQRIFATDTTDGSEMFSDDKSERCSFCGEALLQQLVSFTQKDRLNSDERLKSIIRRTVSDVESSATAKISQIEGTTTNGLDSGETDQRAVLRLFLALGTEPALTLTKLNMNKNLECENCELNIVDSMKDLEITKKKKNKKGK